MISGPGQWSIELKNDSIGVNMNICRNKFIIFRYKVHFFFLQTDVIVLTHGRVEGGSTKETLTSPAAILRKAGAM